MNVGLFLIFLPHPPLADFGVHIASLGRGQRKLRGGILEFISASALRLAGIPAPVGGGADDELPPSFPLPQPVMADRLSAAMRKIDSAFFMNPFSFPMLFNLYRGVAA